VNRHLYERYLHQYIQEAIRNSDGSNRGIYEILAEQQVRGLLVRHKTEKQRALADARKAFDEYSHWPLDIVLSHLGISLETTSS